MVTLVTILALVFPSFGPMAVYHLQKKSIRKEVKSQILAGISLSELAVFRAEDVRHDKVHWVEEHEFVIDGLYYDVVKWVDTDTGQIVYCWPDHAESELERLRTETAMSIFSTQKRDCPSEFISYVTFIRGFFKNTYTLIFSLSLEQERYFSEHLMKVKSVSRGSFHPPEHFFKA